MTIKTDAFSADTISEVKTDAFRAEASHRADTATELGTITVDWAEFDGNDIDLQDEVELPEGFDDAMRGVMRTVRSWMPIKKRAG